MNKYSRFKIQDSKFKIQGSRFKIYPPLEGAGGGSKIQRFKNSKIQRFE